MAEAQKPQGHHSLHIEDRGTLRATGVSRVDFFSDELITAQTALGELHGTGELLARGKVIAFSYTESGPALSFFARLFK